jgi:hypothetical protein
VNPRAAIFISAVSKELSSARQLVANALSFLGYDPDWQEIFGTEEGDLRDVLRRRIDAAKQWSSWWAGVTEPSHLLRMRSTGG